MPPLHAVFETPPLHAVFETPPLCAVLSMSPSPCVQATGTVPDLTTVRAVQKIAWSASSGALCLVHSTNEDIHRAHEKATSAAGGVAGAGAGQEDVSVSGEAMEVLTVCLALCPQALEALNKEKAWQAFIVDLLLLCGSRCVRLSAMEQFTLMATKCCAGQRPLLFFITLLFTVLGVSQSPTTHYPTPVLSQSPTTPYPTLVLSQSPTTPYPTLVLSQSPTTHYPTLVLSQSPTTHYPTLVLSQSPTTPYPTPVLSKSPTPP